MHRYNNLVNDRYNTVIRSGSGEMRVDKKKNQTGLPYY